MHAFEESEGYLSKSTAIVFLTHIINDSIEREMERIAAAANATRNLWATAYLPPDKTVSPSIPPPWTFVPIMQQDIAKLDYDAKLKRVKDWNRLRRNFDLFYLAFYMKHSIYDHYWFIEYDVRYTGDWRLFFDELDGSPADLLCTRMKARQKDSNWSHWPDFVTPVATSDQVNGYMPICRASKRLLSAVDQAYRDGWSGHHEAVWPTVAVSRNLRFEDIGGNGPFVPEARRNRFYLSAQLSPDLEISTFGAWPRYSISNNYHKTRKEARKNLLWHPVK